LTGFRNPNQIASFNSDGTLLCVVDGGAASGQSDITVWDWRNGRQVLAPVQMKLGYGNAGWVPGKRQLVVFRKDGSVCILDATTGRQELCLERIGGQFRIAIDAVGRRIAVAHENVVSLHDLANGRTITSLNLPGPASGVNWHPNGRLLATAVASQVLIWDLVSPAQPLSTLNVAPRTGGILCIFSHDGNWILTQGWDGVSRIWDPRSGLQFLSFTGQATQHGFTSDDRRLPIQETGHAGYLEFEGAYECRTLSGHDTRDGVTSIDFSPDDKWLVSVGLDGARVWDTGTGHAARSPGLACQFCQFDPSGAAVIASGPGGVFRWPMTPGPDGGTLHGPPQLLRPRAGPADRNNGIAHDRTGRWWSVVEREKGQAVVWNSEKPDTDLFLPHANIQFVALSPDGHWAATGTAFGAATKVWDLTTGKLVLDLPTRPNENPDSQVQFSPDGRWLATVSIPYIHLWHVGTWEEAWTLPRASCPNQGPAAFSPDSRLLAVPMSPTEVRLLDTVAGKEVATLVAPGDQIIKALAFSHDGGKLAVATQSASIHLWDLRAIRVRLAEMGLDWNPPLPPFQPADLPISSSKQSAHPPDGTR
jgi:WD40 repeat protein